MMADKKYPDVGGEGALEKIMDKISSSQGPKSSATVWRGSEGEKKDEG